MYDKIKSKIISREEIVIPKLCKETGYVYLLYDSTNTVVYVGKTLNLYSRLSYQRSYWNLNGTKCELLKVKSEDIDFVENYLIKHLQPRLNNRLNSKALTDRVREKKEVGLKFYLSEKRFSISDFAKEIGYARTGIQGYISGTVRLGKKAAMLIHEKTNGRVPWQRVLEDNPPKISEVKKIKEEYATPKKPDVFEQYELPLKVGKT